MPNPQLKTFLILNGLTSINNNHNITYQTTMGYTHYWTPTRITDPAQLGSMIEDAKMILAQSPYIYKNGSIIFNGDALQDQEYETFDLRFNGEWAFCKTARRDYDEGVGAVLLRAFSLGFLLELSSDGNAEDWGAAIELYGDTFGEKPDRWPEFLNPVFGTPILLEE